ncbi:MAG TPA: hypothetical protein P5567_04345 [Kiritimatiellia bacterium]|nr:hypothetical protein [Kiritimatiellia bacterium]HRZ11668.1 hypothetical protein [Kiritimatiellia bacterium]HSA16781.1 hypothetical protein [Kiritimatiellia bacterium]
MVEQVEAAFPGHGVDVRSFYSLEEEGPKAASRLADTRTEGTFFIFMLQDISPGKAYDVQHTVTLETASWSNRQVVDTWQPAVTIQEEMTESSGFYRAR